MAETVSPVASAEMQFGQPAVVPVKVAVSASAEADIAITKAAIAEPFRNFIMIIFFLSFHPGLHTDKLGYDPTQPHKRPRLWLISS
jgi:hypothetical protein